MNPLRADYRCEDVAVFRCLRVACHFQSSICFPGMEEGLILHLSDWAWRQKSIDGIYFTKTWRATTWFRFWQFQTQALKRRLQMHLLAERFISFWSWPGFPSFKTASSNASPGWTVHFFLVMTRVFWKRESRLIKLHQSRRFTPQLFFCFKSIVYGLSV